MKHDDVKIAGKSSSSCIYVPKWVINNESLESRIKSRSVIQEAKYLTDAGGKILLYLEASDPAVLEIIMYSFEYKVAKEDKTNITTSGRVQQIIANKIGLSPATYFRAKKVIEESPELVRDKIRSGKGNDKQSIQTITKRTKKRATSCPSKV